MGYCLLRSPSAAWRSRWEDVYSYWKRFSSNFWWNVWWYLNNRNTFSSLRICCRTSPTRSRWFYLCWCRTVTSSVHASKAFLSYWIMHILFSELPRKTNGKQEKRPPSLEDVYSLLRQPVSDDTIKYYCTKFSQIGSVSARKLATSSMYFF